MAQMSAAYDRNQDYLVKGMTHACASLESITFEGNWKAEISRNGDGCVASIVWIEGIEDDNIFSGSRTENYSSAHN
jgi:hypothetical protein